MRSARLVALVLLAAGPLVARAVDAPHEAGLFCSNCHVGHQAPGAALTTINGNFNLCNSCHKDSANFGFPGWTDAIQAVPGVSGRSHRWDALATNMGATAPSTSSSNPDEVAMAKRLDNGKLMCSTCHDQHSAQDQPIGARGPQTVSGVSPPGFVSVIAPVAAGATPKRYLIDVVQAGSETTALFRLSNDNGVSWFGCSTPTTYTFSQTYVDAATTGCVAGPTVPMNDGANVSVAFGAASYVAGDQFSFYVSYPFVRADVTNSKMCLVCHKDRNMTAANVQGTDTMHAGTGQPIVLGTTVFHHPVMEALATTPLDANGVSQTGSGDGNPSNDLVLGDGGVVSCLTCHRVHNVDSNSLSPH